MKSHHTRWSSFSIALFACAAGLHAQPTFSGLTMINPTGSNNTFATAINAGGQVLVVDDYSNLFVWSSGGSTQITNDFGSGPVYASYGRALNDSGQVTGYAEVGEDYHHFIWSSGGGMTAIGVDYITEVRGLNNSGQVVGQASGEPDYGFVWSGGGGTTVLNNPYANIVYAYAINSSGQVAGTTYDGDGDTVALRWEANGDVTEIGVLGMGSVTAMNDSGHVVGSRFDADTFTDKAFYWDGVSMTFIDALPGDDEGVYAGAINASGDVVGTSEGDEERAYLFSSGVMFDLNALAAGFLVENGGDTAGFVSLENAYGINDAGQIVGQGLYYDGIGDTYGAAFFLDNATVVPEPAAFAMLAGLGALGFAACRRRRRIG